MADMVDKPIKRTQSRETLLKREFNALKKELATIEQKIQDFEDLEVKKAELEELIPKAKAALITEMGLD